MSPKILLVDDDPLIHRLFRPHLERNGYLLISAINGHEAIAFAANDQPALIIMDILMPALDGLAAIRHLKRAEATKAIPIIVVTANAGHNAFQREAENAGAAGFLTKPLSPAQLVAEVKRRAPLLVAESPPKLPSN